MKRKGPSIKYVNLKGIRVSATERYIGVGVSWQSLRSLLNSVFVRLAVHIRLIALIAMPNLQKVYTLGETFM